MRHLILSAPKMPGSSALGVKALFSFLRKNYLYVVFFLVLIGAGWPGALHAEGSRDLFPANAPAGARRVQIYPQINTYLSSTEKDWWPFINRGTHYVYAEVGEQIALASNAIGWGYSNSNYGRIIVYPPSGATTNTTTYQASNANNVNAKAGYIRHRAAELAGPKDPGGNNVGGNTNCYTPFFYTVKETGIHRIEFYAPRTRTDLNTTSSTNPTARYVNRTSTSTSLTNTSNTEIWSQTTNTDTHINAWDITVYHNSRTSTNPSWERVPGRVYTNILNFTGANTIDGCKFYGETYALTSDGYVYKVSPNGMSGMRVAFFVNNQGLTSERDGGGKPMYKSSATYSKANLENPTSSQVNLKDYYYTKDPRKKDSSTSITHKMFYSDPTSSSINYPLPASASVHYSDNCDATGETVTTWLKTEVKVPTIDQLSIIGLENKVEGQVGKNGGYIKFKASLPGYFVIKIEGTATDGKTFHRELTGSAVDGINEVLWDGKDDDGNYPPSNDYHLSSKVSLRGAEVHFPYIDVESNPTGFTLNRLTPIGGIDPNAENGERNFETNRYLVYWNDSIFTTTGRNANRGRTYSGGTNYDRRGTNTAPTLTSPLQPSSSQSGAHYWTGTANTDDGWGDRRVVDTWTYIQGAESEQQIGEVRTPILDLAVKEVNDKDANGVSTLKQSTDGKYEITYVIPVQNLAMEKTLGDDDDAEGAVFNFVAPAGFKISGWSSESLFNETGSADYNKTPYNYKKIAEARGEESLSVGGKQYGESLLNNQVANLENKFALTAGGVGSTSLSGSLDLLFNSTHVFTITLVSESSTLPSEIFAAASVTRPKDVTDYDATYVVKTSSSDEPIEVPTTLNPLQECGCTSTDGKIKNYDDYANDPYPCNNIKNNLITIAAAADAALTVSASCIHCDITATASVGDNISNYTLYYYATGGQAKPVEEFTGSEKTGSITFKFAQDGLDAIPTTDGKLIFYIAAGNGKRSQDVTVNIYPDSATWIGTTGKTSTWKEATNWTSKTGGYPIWCTDVLIPENNSSITIYPVAKGDETNAGTDVSKLADACRDITFEHGASVAQVHKLHYRRAFVQFRPERNRWYTLAAPLKYMYFADYTFTDDESKVGETYGISPKVFSMYFDQVSPDKTHSLDGEKGNFQIGSFSKPFTRLEEPFSSPNGQGQAFALWVNGVGKDLSYPTDAFPAGSHYTFPRLGGTKDEPTELVYHYHDARTGAHVRDAAITKEMRGKNLLNNGQWEEGHKSTNYMDVSNFNGADYRDNRYRFAFEDMVSGNNVTLPLKGTTSPGGAKTLMLANPFMSYMDFSEIASANSSKIELYYRIWDGITFETVPTGPIWSEINKSEKTHIAPMQSVFVERKVTEASTVEFDMTAALVDPKAKDSEYHSLRSSQSNPKDALYLDLDMQGVKTRAIVALRENASTNYIDGEDIFKLFSPNEVPEVYTLSNDQVASEINLIPNLSKQRIPVGIAMEGTGRGTLTVSGLEDFATAPIYFCDEQTGQKQDLHTNPVVTIEKNLASEKLTQRYFLEINRASTAIEAVETLENDIQWIREAGSLMFYSQTSAIQSVEMYDISGHSIQSFAPKGSSCVISTARFNKGIYLFQVVSDKQTKTIKLTF